MKYSTSTITAENKITPWLAASGPLSYSPFTPPDKDYFFLYNYILPNIFSGSTNLRKHYWFGNYATGRDCFSIKVLQDFWKDARSGKVNPIFVQDSAEINAFEAPIAIFNHPVKWCEPLYIFIQHGSYLKISVSQQPLLDETGYVLVHRGVGKVDKFNVPRMPEDEYLVDQYREVQFSYFSDSVRSFNVAHASIFRSEVTHLKSEMPLLPEKLDDENIRDQLRKLLNCTRQCFTLNENIAKYKFGPSYVTFKTPATNIRICTFFSGEEEVQILSPDKLIPVSAMQCKFVNNPVTTLSV